MQNSNGVLRPSVLPKLAVCGSYRSDGEENDATRRGTKLDTVLRALLQKKNVNVGDLTSDEQAAVKWAEKTALALAGSFPIQADEEYLHIEGWGDHGTADVLCEDAHWSADLKSGMKRNYVEAMAAYAKGFMERYFLEEWTVYIFYCDLEEVETLRFTLESATELVCSAVANSHDNKPPVANEYCGWCSNKWGCPARKEQLGLVAFNDRELKFEDANSSLLREFVLRAGTVEDFAEKARAILLDRAIKGEKIPGVSVVKGRTSKIVSERIIELNLLKLGVADVLAVYGPMSATKLREIWQRKMPDAPFPEKEVIETHGAAYVRVSQPKQTK